MTRDELACATLLCSKGGSMQRNLQRQACQVCNTHLARDGTCRVCRSNLRILCRAMGIEALGNMIREQHADLLQRIAEGAYANQAVALNVVHQAWRPVGGQGAHSDAARMEL